jgi:hypothetical protein
MYVSAEEENSPSRFILNMVSTPLYTSESIFLGAASASQWAFPNVKKVILKVYDPSDWLEGKSTPKITKNVNFQWKIETSEDTPVTSPSPDGYENDKTQLIPENDPGSINMAGFKHGPTDPVDTATTDGLLSEDPVSLTEVLESGDPTLDIHSTIVGCYSEDLLFDLIMKNLLNYKNFEVSNNLIIVKYKEQHLLCILDIKLELCYLQEILISHAHSILAHLRPKKTITYLWDNVWWKGLNFDVEAFCQSCSICSISKPSNHTHCMASYTLSKCLHNLGRL